MPDKSSETLSCTLREQHLSDEAAIRYLTVGKIVCELMSAEKPINRKAICCKLLKRLEHAGCQEEERVYYRLIRMLFGRY
ncbi:two-component-system connector protein YcgZ [Candidatus Pantoea deserta]|uniref:Two-component-system connector protein YcgZ n=1 Tax=Candidatus Pantoea deserta TaxID=1869313 RepID=A0A3N4PBI4_9GAMM|nr:two-component-system connector protein YcgZ [Pantoea deserta]RPD96883.1 two-component-system connector protein YcgZ [Pantoea deserta]